MHATIVEGKYDLADWLFLIAAIVLAVYAVAIYARQAVPRDWVPSLLPIGLCLLAVGLLVL